MRELELKGYSLFALQQYFSQQQCNILSRITPGVHCAVLHIAVFNRSAVSDLIN